MSAESMAADGPPVHRGGFKVPLAAQVLAGRGARAGGAMLSGATRAVSALRTTSKPLHPSGEIRVGRIRRDGSEPAAGVPWLDEPGEDEAMVRLSRAVGLPAAMPDIHGMAIRVLDPVGDADLLLASTGWGRLTRFVLTASRDPSARPLTTLLPYRTHVGPVLIGARATGPDSYTLAWAPGTGTWRRFGVLSLGLRLPSDPRLSFDPVRRGLPGLEQYPAVARLREPAYHRARAASDREPDRRGERG